MIYEMDLTLEGSTRRRSMDLLSNYVTATYIDEAGDSQTTAPASSSSSIYWYGRKEELLTLDGYARAAAEHYRDTYLKEHAWPWARPVGAMRGMGDDQLQVTVCGYVFTANWRYVTWGDGTMDDADNYIQQILSTDCADYLLAGRIGQNTVQVKKSEEIQTRAFDVISEITALGDTSDNPWRFYVSADQRANYMVIDTTPSYYLRGGKLYASAGGSQEIEPWIVTPNVVRDMSYPVKKQDYAGWLADARDFYIEEVEAGPGGLSLQTELFEESALLAAQQSYEQSMRNVSQSAATGGGGGKGNLNWKRKQGLTPGTPGWDEATRIGKAAWWEKYRSKKAKK
jgi:hypothetical protein